MPVNRQRHISRFICRHHSSKNHTVSGVCLPYRCCRISMYSAAEHLPHPFVSLKPICKSFRSVIVSLFSCVFRVNRFFTACRRGLDQISFRIQKADPILNKQYIFPETFYSRCRYHRLLRKRILSFCEILIPFCSCWFYNDRTE